MPDQNREIFTVRQAAHYLGISVDTLYKYVGEQRVPAFKLGNRWRFKKSLLDSWIQAETEQRILKGLPRAGEI